MKNTLALLILCFSTLALAERGTIDLGNPGQSPVMSRDAALVAVIVEDVLPSQVRIYDTTTKKEVQRWNFPPLPGQVLQLHSLNGGIWPTRPATMVFSLNGRELIIGYWGGEVRSYDVASGQQMTRFPTMPDGVTSLSIAENASTKVTHLAAADSQGNVSVWDYHSLPVKRLQHFQHGHFPSIDIQDGAQLIAVSTPTGEVRVWNLVTGKEVLRGNGPFHKNRNVCGTVSFAGATEILIATGPALSPQIVRLDLVTGRTVQVHQTNIFATGVPGVYNNFPALGDFTFSADGKIALGGNRISIPSVTWHTGVPLPYTCAHVASLATGKHGTLSPGSPVNQNSSAVSRSGKVAVTVSTDLGPTPVYSLRVWDL